MATKEKSKDPGLKKSKDNTVKKSKDKISSPNKQKKRSKKSDEPTVASTGTTLVADDKNVDSKLSSLFATKRPVVKPTINKRPTPEPTADSEDGDNDDANDTLEAVKEPIADVSTVEDNKPGKKRKRGEQADDLEDNYMRKLARQHEKHEEEAKRDGERASAVVEPLGEDSEDEDVGLEEHDVMDIDENEGEEEGEEHYTPPQHESMTGTSTELDKANRTVFIGNVSTSAITTKSDRKILEKHLTSFFDQLPKAKDDKAVANKLESLRFRSTPYAPTLPKKAAYARGEVMSTTTQSTNAYAVYSSQMLAREACKRLNGTIILDRHMRVDSVAHPAPVDHKRCVFVGNLGFVDDETNMIAANEAEGREKRKQNQKPSDVEEGLWRLFAKHGTIESVRVIRDKGTRVGIGIAYVQFTDENAVEGALSEEGKKAPPMLPRKLRVTRAKAMKKSKPAPVDRSSIGKKAEGYQRKITAGESTLRGRVGKLMGKAAAAMTSGDFKHPESFVFEGHRASSSQKKSGLKLGKGGKRSAKPTGRSAKRAAAFKSGSIKKSTRAST